MGNVQGEGEGEALVGGVWIGCEWKHDVLVVFRVCLFVCACECCVKKWGWVHTTPGVCCTLSQP